MRLIAFVLLAFSLLCICPVVMLAGAHMTEHNFARARFCRQPISPARNAVSTGAFDGATTYGTNYHAHQLPDKPHFAPPPPPAHTRFDATTTNHDDYRAYEMQPREKYGPKHAPRENTKFDATTTNHVRKPSLSWFRIHFSCRQYCSAEFMRCKPRERYRRT